MDEKIREKTDLKDLEKLISGHSEKLLNPSKVWHPSNTNIIFALYDKNFFFSYDWIIKRLEDLLGKDFSKHEIDKFIQNDLFPQFNQDDGTAGFPQYAVDRTEFLSELVRKWNYSFRTLKLITEYEDSIIDFAMSLGINIYNRNISNLDFLIEYLEREIAENTAIVQQGENQEYCKMLDKQTEQHRYLVTLLKGRKIEDLTEEIVDAINARVFDIKFNVEWQCHEDVNLFRAQLLLGFSPGVFFDGYAVFIEGQEDLSNLPSNIDIPAEYPYEYQYKRKIYKFGKLRDAADIEEHNFFATPDYAIEGIDEERVNISIRNLHNVNSKNMRKIGKMYSKLRNQLNPPKAGWGEKSGKKNWVEKRNKKLREIFWNLRKNEPHISAERHLTKAISQLGEFGLISDQTAKRIVYTRDKNHEKMSARDS